MTTDANELEVFEDFDPTVLVADMASDYMDLARCIGLTGVEDHDTIRLRAIMLWEKYKDDKRNSVQA